MALKLGGIFGKILKILGKITDVLVKGREAGLYSKKPGPQSPQFFASESAEVVKVENGMSHTLAAGFSVFSMLAVSAAQGLDWSLLTSDPKRFLSSFVAALLVAWGLYLQRPGQALVNLGSTKEVQKEAESVDSLKLSVPIRTDGGK